MLATVGILPASTPFQDRKVFAGKEEMLTADLTSMSNQTLRGGLQMCVPTFAAAFRKSPEDFREELASVRAERA